MVSWACVYGHSPPPSTTPHQDKGYQETPYSTATYTVQPWCWLVRQALGSSLTCIPVPNSAPMAVLRWLSSPHGLHEQAKKQQGIPASCVHVASSSALCGGECGRVLCNPQSTRQGGITPWLLCLQYLIFRSTWSSERNGARCCCPGETSCFWSSASGMNHSPELAPTSMN